MTKQEIADRLERIRIAGMEDELDQLAAAVRSLPGASDLIAAVKDMAEKCHLQNSEQISELQGAIGAVLMIRLEYLDLLKKYCARTDPPR